MARVFNFNAGPAVLPIEVLEQAREHLLEMPGEGLSILEMSHRAPAFDTIIEEAEADLRELLGLTPNYHVLFLQGGASLQFSMVPMNLLQEGQTADYLITGDWGKKALAEARKVAEVNEAASVKADNFNRVPHVEEMHLNPDASYVHFTTNETIHGVEWQAEPQTGSVPLVADASSDILSRPIDVERYGLIYAGAQKNMGPSGVTLVIVRDDIVHPTPKTLPTMLDYKTHISKRSLYNTPNTFGIYIIGLVLKWLKNLGGLAAMWKLNEQKAGYIYQAIDASDFYRGHAKPDSRSLMNITFRLPSEDLERRFAREAAEAGMVGLAGHRDVGGLRASVYNAFPLEGARALAEFMTEFERQNG